MESRKIILMNLFAPISSGDNFPISKLGKKYVKAVYCHPAYSTYMHSTLCEMLDWMKHKLESRLSAEI